MFDIFTYDFMLRAFAAGLTMAVIAPFIGTFLVVRHYSYLADTLAHVSLLGVALGVMLHIHPLVGAVVTAVVAALLMERLRTRKKVWSEAVLSLFLSGSLAIAVVLLSLTNGLNVNLLSILFGSITTVTTQDLWLMLGVGILVLACLVFFFKEFFLIAYGEELAGAEGIPVARLNSLFLVMSAFTVALAIRTVGVLLVGALMVIPVLTAIPWKRGFRGTIVLAIGTAVVSVILGLFSSFYLDIASGGAIVLTALVLFIGSTIARSGA